MRKERFASPSLRASIGAKLFFRKGRNLDIMDTLYQMHKGSTEWLGPAYGPIVSEP